MAPLDARTRHNRRRSPCHTASPEMVASLVIRWIMKEAKARNPSIQLYGLPWTFPGWVTASGRGGRTGNSNLSAIADVLTPSTAEYVSKWVDGAKTHHNLTIDYVGLWNEHPPTPDYTIFLRRALDASRHGTGARIVAPDWHVGRGEPNTLEPFMKALHSNRTVQHAIDRVGFHYPHRLSNASAELGPLYTNFPVPVWSSEESSTTDTPAGGACWARLLNQNYVIGNITATIMWNLVTSFYPTLPYYGASLMDAAEPWSGHYTTKSPVWATAHHTQFAFPGWRYLLRGEGVGVLAGGGTIVTYASPVADASGARQWTTVVEKIRSSTGPCLRDSFHNDSFSPETLILRIGRGLQPPGLLVQTWLSDWAAGNGTTEADLFRRGPVLTPAVDADGWLWVNITVGVDQVVTATSLSRAAGFGRHGRAGSSAPPSKPFPAMYANDFESLPLNADEPYLADQAGHWEVRAEAGKSENRVLSQVCPEIGVVYRGDSLPTAVLGDPAWRDLTVSLRFRVDSPSAAGIYVGARARNVASSGRDPAKYPLPQGTQITGAYLGLYLNGTVAVTNVNTALQHGPALKSLSEAPMMLRKWYNLTLVVAGNNLAFSVRRMDGTGPSRRGRFDSSIGHFPATGQFGLGLINYGAASIDDLVIHGYRKQSEMDDNIEKRT